jgi:transposase InsO family protein
MHVAVTASPTVDWVKQQIREATAWDEAPRYLLHDNDGIFGQYRLRERGRHRCALDFWLEDVMGIRGIPIPYGAPNANAHIERFMGTLRRECLDHFICVSEAHLRRTASKFVSYCNELRPHQGIDGIPALGPGIELSRHPPPTDARRLVAEPILGGLHHNYRLAA